MASHIVQSQTLRCRLNSGALPTLFAAEIESAALDTEQPDVSMYSPNGIASPLLLAPTITIDLDILVPWHNVGWEVALEGLLGQAVAVDFQDSTQLNGVTGNFVASEYSINTGFDSAYCTATLRLRSLACGWLTPTPGHLMDIGNFLPQFGVEAPAPEPKPKPLKHLTIPAKYTTTGNLTEDIRTGVYKPPVKIKPPSPMSAQRRISLEE